MKDVSVSVLSKFLKITERRIQILCKDGVLTKHRRGEYPLIENVHRYIDYINARVPTDAGEIDGDELNVKLKQEKLRLTKYQANEQKVKAELAEKNVVNIEDVDLYLANIFSLMREKLLSIPDRVEAELIGETDTAVFSKKLTAEIKESIYQVCEGVDETMSKIQELSDE